MKTLVVYDSLYGNTRTIAQAITDAIPGEVNLVHIGEVERAATWAKEIIDEAVSLQD